MRIEFADASLTQTGADGMVRKWSGPKCVQPPSAGGDGWKWKYRAQMMIDREGRKNLRRLIISYGLTHCCCVYTVLWRV